MLQIARRIHIIYQGIGKWDKELIMKQAMAGEKRDHAQVLEDIMPFVLTFNLGADAKMLDDLIEFEQTLEFERLRARTRYHCMQRDIYLTHISNMILVLPKQVDRIKCVLALASTRNSNMSLGSNAQSSPSRACGKKNLLASSDLFALSKAQVPDAPRVVVGVVKAMLSSTLTKDNHSTEFTKSHFHTLSHPSEKNLKAILSCQRLISEGTSYMTAYCHFLPTDQQVFTRGKFEADCVPSLAAPDTHAHA